jgi:xanthine dehydrogenase accessory factor
MTGDQSAHLLVYPDGSTVGDFGGATAEGVQAALAAYADRESREVELAGEPVFIQVFPRKDQLLIIGAAHATLALVAFARQLRFETIVIDPRKVFSDASRFSPPPDRLLQEWPQDVLPGLGLNEDTYAVLLTHDPKIDDPALHRLLRSPVAYIGALGSRRTQEKRRERLRKQGFSEEEIGRIHGPVGLDIGAQTPDEIALSVIAEVVRAKNERRA